jgi:hypothetical protein
MDMNRQRHIGPHVVLTKGAWTETAAPFARKKAKKTRRLAEE